MPGLLSLKVLLKRPVGLGSTTLTRIETQKTFTKIQVEVISGEQRVKHGHVLAAILSKSLQRSFPDG